MDSKITFFSLNVGMSASLAGPNAIIKAENLDIIFHQEVCLSAEQIEQQLRGFKASVNRDESQLSKPGTAIVWKESFPVTDVCPLTLCRLQVATLGPYKLLNLYAPSGSDKKYGMFSLVKRFLKLCIWIVNLSGWLEGIIILF